MKLGTRVSAFFLTALAIILIGNSVLLFVVARYYLLRRFDEQLESALNTLVAAVEVEDDDVKWEPTDHTVKLGLESDVEDIRWLVFNERHIVVAHSPNLVPPFQNADLLSLVDNRANDRQFRSGWRILKHGGLSATHPKPAAERTPLEHAELTVVAARNSSELTATLHRLGVALIALPTMIWLVSALGGRWFCEQAIAPLRSMVASIRGIKPDDTTARLHVPPSRDELAELGNAFNVLLDQVFLAFERQRRFSGDAAHQLRTPLTVLQGQVEVALRKPRSTSEYESTLHIVNQEVISLRQTVEALLFLVRGEQDASLPDLQMLDIGAWLPSYMNRWQTTERWNDISFHVDDRPICQTSPILLSQVLDILLSNAINYSRAGTPITIRATRQAYNLLIEVADQGLGISADDLRSIFVPFFRGQDARQTGAAGTGLGLAIAQRIATSLKGNLQCTSQPGAGSRFSFSIPLPGISGAPNGEVRGFCQA